MEHGIDWNIKTKTNSCIHLLQWRWIFTCVYLRESRLCKWISCCVHPTLYHQNSYHGMWYTYNFCFLYLFFTIVFIVFVVCVFDCQSITHSVIKRHWIHSKWNFEKSPFWNWIASDYMRAHNSTNHSNSPVRFQSKNKIHKQTHENLNLNYEFYMWICGQLNETRTCNAYRKNRDKNQFNHQATIMCVNVCLCLFISTCGNE